jgi:hypothetical protein
MRQHPVAFETIDDFTERCAVLDYDGRVALRKRPIVLNRITEPQRRCRYDNNGHDHNRDG